MYFDSHTHANFSAYKDDADQVVKRALDAQTWMLNVGTQQDTSKSAVAMAEKYPEGVYAAIGLHPSHTFQHMMDEEESHFESRSEEFDADKYSSLLDSKKVVAVGECGLDYFRLETSNKEQVIRKQKTELIKQLHFADRHSLPITFHCRDAYEDLIEILKAEFQGQGVIHSFTDTWETAKKFLDLGFYIGLNGILTFDKTGKLAEVVKNAPFDRILIETDAPYLAPPPYRGKRNEPLYVQYVAGKIAEIKGLNWDQVGEQTFQNAKALFKI
jgi:TatD DNase family protein